jgi:putative hydrolases of HD superfamily
VTGDGDPLDALRIGDADRARLAFLIASHALTGVQRINRVLDSSRPETTAEHSWHLALTALMLQDHAGPDVALPRVVEMVLIHDVVEVDVGDVPVYDIAGREAIAVHEQRAAQRLFGLLPGDEARGYLALWREFEAGETDDARFARALDRIQPVLMHWAGGGTVWLQRGTTAADEARVLGEIERFWPPLLALGTALIDDAIARGWIAP